MDMARATMVETHITEDLVRMRFANSPELTKATEKWIEYCVPIENLTLPPSDVPLGDPQEKSLREIRLAAI